MPRHGWPATQRQTLFSLRMEPCVGLVRSRASSFTGKRSSKRSLAKCWSSPNACQVELALLLVELLVALLELEVARGG
eukprot:8891239-Alexandrium_andersonii.AAC.1